MSEKKHHAQSDKKFYQKGRFIAIAFVIFTVLFVVSFYINKESAITKYNEASQASPAIKNYGSPQKTLDIFSKYGAAMGVGLGILALIKLYILYGIAAIARLNKYAATVPSIMLLVFGTLMAFGIELVFFENRYSTVGNGIIIFLGYPLLYTGIILTLLSAGLLTLSIIKKA